MRLFLSDQTHRLPEHLAELMQAPLMAFHPEDLRTASSSVELGTGPGINDRAVKACMAYRIFPVNIMRALAQWEQEARAMRVGDTIVQQVHLPPFVGLSQKLVFGVRITEVIDETDRKGFSYATLEGHVEKGVSTFTVHRREGMVSFHIDTCSAPASWLSSLVAPFFSRPYQAYCTREALKNLKVLTGSPDLAYNPRLSEYHRK